MRTRSVNVLTGKPALGADMWMAFGLVIAWAALVPAFAATAQEDASGSDQTPGEIEPEGDPERSEPDRPVLAEGAFLVREAGVMAPLESGGWAFAFERDDRGRAPAPPMALLPCATLEQMERVTPASEKRVRLVVSGQVFVYRNRNYLLPTMFAFPSERNGEKDHERANGDSASEREAEENAEPQKQREASERAASADPSVEALIESIETLSEDRGEPVWAPPSGDGQHAGLRPDSSFLESRRGRLIRENASGRLVFSIDNDADESPGGDSPLTILPCLNRERMERLLEGREGSLSMTVSGRVFTHRGRNYLIPTMFQIASDQGVGLRSAR